jgi:diacylglycerol kinase
MSSPPEALTPANQSKRAKDIGSAAALLSLMFCAGIWLAALYQRFGP